MRLFFLALFVLSACAPDLSDCDCAAGELCRAGRCVVVPVAFASGLPDTRGASPVEDAALSPDFVEWVDGWLESDATPVEVDGEPAAEDAGDIGTDAVLFGDVAGEDAELSADLSPDVDAALLDAAVPEVDAVLPCQSGVGFAATGACYAAFEAAVTWQAAEEACVVWGGHLASLHSDAEVAFVGRLSPHTLWIGYRVGDATWTDGSPLDYTHWNLNEPNGDGGAPTCTQMFFWEERWWNDINCNVVGAANDGFYTGGFVCKRSAAAVDQDL